MSKRTHGTTSTYIFCLSLLLILPLVFGASEWHSYYRNFQAPNFQLASNLGDVRGAFPEHSTAAGNVSIELPPPFFIDLHFEFNSSRIDLNNYRVQSISGNISPFNYNDNGLGQVHRVSIQDCFPVVDDINNDGTTDVVTMGGPNQIIFREFNETEGRLNTLGVISPVIPNAAYAACPILFRNGTDKLVITTIFDNFGWAAYLLTANKTVTRVFERNDTFEHCGSFGQIACAQMGNGDSICATSSYDTSNCAAAITSQDGYLNIFNLRNLSTYYRSIMMDSGSYEHGQLVAQPYFNNVKFNAVTYNGVNPGRANFNEFLYNGTATSAKCTTQLSTATNVISQNDNFGSTSLTDLAFGTTTAVVWSESGADTIPDDTFIAHFTDGCVQMWRKNIAVDTYEWNDPIAAVGFCENLGVEAGIGVLSRELQGNDMYFDCFSYFDGTFDTVHLPMSFPTGVGTELRRQSYYSENTLPEKDGEESERVTYVYNNYGIFRFAASDVNFLGFFDGDEDDILITELGFYHNGTLFPIDLDHDGFLDLWAESPAGADALLISGQQVNNSLPNMSALRGTPSPLCVGFTYNFFPTVQDAENDDVTVRVDCFGNNSYFDEETTSLSVQFPSREVALQCDYNTTGIFTQKYYVRDTEMTNFTFAKNNILEVTNSTTCNNPTVVTAIDLNQFNSGQTGGSGGDREAISDFWNDITDGDSLIAEMIWIVVGMIIGIVLVVSVPAGPAHYVVLVIMLFYFIIGVILGVLSPLWAIVIFLVLGIAAGIVFLRVTYGGRA